MLDRFCFEEEKLSKEVYKPIHDGLIDRLVVLQQRAYRAGIGLVVLLEGWNGAGKGSRISDLMYNLDARAASVSVTKGLDLDEAELFDKLGTCVSGYYPLMQEFWQALGPRGAITFFDRGWYTKATQLILYRLFGKNLGKTKKAGAKSMKKLERHMQDQLDPIREFELQLSEAGYTVVKLFLHISKEEQERRLTELYENPSTRWRVSKDKLKRTGNYDQAYRIYDDLLASTDFEFAPWTVIDAHDKRRANLDIAAALVEALELALAKNEQAKPPQGERGAGQSLRPAPLQSRFAQEEHRPTLESVDYRLALAPDEYHDRLKAEQKRLYSLELEMYRARIPLVVVFEGWDAAGKGGAIKRIAQALDARSYTIFPSPAPTNYEKLHPHLWRYWTRLPKAGHVGIYDRSWYGRVLVERVEGFATEAAWSRAFDEINGFEKDLAKWGAIIVKFWVEVSQEEQLSRFEARQADPAKNWKITDEDWRNRENYPDYRTAVEDMFRLTSTKHAPWTILTSEDKYYARVQALQIINDVLEARLRET